MINLCSRYSELTGNKVIESPPGLLSYFGFEEEQILLPSIDWENRKIIMEHHIGGLWQKVVGFVGTNKIRRGTSNSSIARSITCLDPIPTPKVNWVMGMHAAACFPDWRMLLGNAWLLEESDLPKNWRQMNINQVHIYIAAMIRNNKLSAQELDLIEKLKEPEKVRNMARQLELYKELSAIISEDSSAFIIKLINQGEWESARSGTFAHELGHLSGSGFDDNKTDPYKARLYEKEADFIASSIGFKDGLLAYMKTATECSPHETDKEVIDITSPNFKKSHPTLMTRYNYISRF